MKFTLDSLESGWLEVQIEHLDKRVTICASNIMGGDFVVDMMTALYESLSEKATRMVAWSNENSGFGLLFEPLPDGNFRVGKMSIDDWCEDVFENPDQAWENYNKAAPMFNKCGVYRGEIVENRSILTETFDAMTKLQILGLSCSLLFEFERFKYDKGKIYYDDNWIHGSGNLNREGNSSFLCEKYDRLYLLVDHINKSNCLGVIKYTRDNYHQEYWDNLVNDYWEKRHKFREPNI